MLPLIATGTERTTNAPRECQARGFHAPREAGRDPRTTPGVGVGDLGNPENVVHPIWHVSS